MDNKLTDILLLKNLLNERPQTDYNGLLQPLLLILVIYFHFHSMDKTRQIYNNPPNYNHSYNYVRPHIYPQIEYY